MKAAGIRTTVRTGTDRHVERARVLLLAGVIAAGIGAYLALGAAGTDRDHDRERNLLPYQALVRTLPESEQSVFRAIRSALPSIEADRGTTSRWPEASTLAELAARGMERAGGVPLGPADAGSRAVLHWERSQHATTVSYLGMPTDPAAPAWLVVIQEPEPGAPPDPAPNDEEHQRLPDGTVLHIYVWTHRYGGRVTAGAVLRPQNDGWIEVLTAPPNPVRPTRR